METFWNKIGDKFLSKIKRGDLEVHFSNGNIKTYGDKTYPKAKLILNNAKLFKRLTFYGDIGFAESYMDKDFECEDLTSLIKIALLNSNELQTKSEDEKSLSLYNLFPFFNKIKHFLRKNSKTRAQKNIQEHYDLSNDFFKLMLDDTMMYSAAVFQHENEDLFEAQNRKLDVLAKKLNLKKGSKVLEIGSGWGAMAMHLVKKYECEVTTLTLSKEQKKLCEDRFKEHKIEESINIMLKDYRDMQGEFDAIIAVEMFEAVGREYFDIFFKKCQSLLKPHGVLVMQIITMPDQRYNSYCKGTDFIQKYIFPGGHLPSVGKILETTTKHTKLNLLHMEEFTEHYAKTLNIWHKNFLDNLEEVQKLGFDEYFIRMWKMYLCYCEAGFLTRNINLVQLVFTRYENMHLNEGLVA
ncbi:SAM-dependent methyltransferase [Halarcobacter bivalviorum]|uniref:Cyclopropane-fatty-acyl-phospholipid synthase n=1 Tax=Halarcobacter bivalviorum TaxID=663364 RepID=A0AAX2ACQ6_9BACT|nr:cyclopropane-fatty-acyl-phospholipid synthase family protein [Halarcobacter bivalviorum]AXH12120.1 cyclopropane fatty acyl phospholipid synthase [Halarcobacter bivalviorum]RXK11230.1 cyclopropane-fatty-acyl-phospholipid synthase [Halarcobacter bivalviorum]